MTVHYFEKAIGKSGIRKYEASSDVNGNSRSKDGVNVAIKKYKDHPTIKMNNENVLNHVLVLKKCVGLISKKRFVI